MIGALGPQNEVDKLKSEIGAGFLHAKFGRIGNKLESNDEVLSFAANTVSAISRLAVGEYELNLIVERAVLSYRKYGAILACIKHLDASLLDHQRSGGTVCADDKPGFLILQYNITALNLVRISAPHKHQPESQCCDYHFYHVFHIAYYIKTVSGCRR